MVYGADANSADCADGVGGMDGYAWDVITTTTDNGRDIIIGKLMRILRRIIAVVFFAAAIVLGFMAAKNDNLLLWLASIAAISVAIMVDDNKRRDR